MRKLVGAFLVAVFCVVLAGCGSTHTEMVVPANVRLSGVECGQPCAVYYDLEKDAIVLQMANGDTITIVKEQQQGE